MVAHTFKPNTQEGEAKFEASLSTRASSRTGTNATEKPCLGGEKKANMTKEDCYTSLLLCVPKDFLQC